LGKANNASGHKSGPGGPNFNVPLSALNKTNTSNLNICLKYFTSGETLSSAFSISQIKPNFKVFSQIEVQLGFSTSAAFSVLHVDPTNHTNAFTVIHDSGFSKSIDPKLHCACLVFHEIDTQIAPLCVIRVSLYLSDPPSSSNSTNSIIPQVVVCLWGTGQ
jgi:hypothetical protein